MSYRGSLATAQEVVNWTVCTKILIFKWEGIIKKFSYERRDYESVDKKSLSQSMSRKTTKKELRQ